MHGGDHCGFSTTIVRRCEANSPEVIKQVDGNPCNQKKSATEDQVISLEGAFRNHLTEFLEIDPRCVGYSISSLVVCFSSVCTHLHEEPLGQCCHPWKSGESGTCQVQPTNAGDGHARLPQQDQLQCWGRCRTAAYSGGTLARAKPEGLRYLSTLVLLSSDTLKVDRMPGMLMWRRRRIY